VLKVLLNVVKFENFEDLNCSSKSMKESINTWNFSFHHFSCQFFFKLRDSIYFIVIFSIIII